MIEYFQILCGIAIVLLYLYYHLTSNYDFWKKLNIPGPAPTILFGNLKEIAFRKESMSESVKRLYDEFKHEPLFGIFEATTPTLIVNDLDLIKDVLVKDFPIFADRGLPYYKKVEPLAEHLFFLESERWKPLRTKLSPTFTSGKLKEMFPLIIDCAQHLEEYLDKRLEKQEPIECRELAAKFTTDVIGNCVFGIITNALSDENSKFREMGRRILEPCFRTTVRAIIRQFFPRLYVLIGNYIQAVGVNEFFTNMVSDSMRYRKENNIYRPDFINTLMELREHPEKLPTVELTDEFLTAQALILFLAGFETSSTTISHTLYELAQNHEIQDKLRKEIKQHDEKYGKTLTYDQIKEMKYLEKVFKETLRKYPILPMLPREALKNYTFNGTKITIPKGTKVWIPTFGIHRDPNIYPDPDRFDPERFTEEAVANRHPMSFLAFGDGPRICIGARFANYQVKLGIITILRNHKLDVCEETIIPFKHEPQALLLTLQGGITLKITKM
ncbi:cytochrome P450 6A1-like [Osmia lignaria lignaria]|uniref:cytochrome P450 6A1-like n=1 Tax=Osmia lignaria lignaria TaxID=1437193 RepID=UPI00402BD016